ncbi:sensor histidine kinase [Thermomonospora cellulosilytica]|uniref:histidine kinase n=1 Tax=Thermomonospora cellulosilytica TaxID=1411118 RepID=A0A7W3MWA6_9ACTN|nr:ATP-binding protein [Thermomonospora cellulosilytica]MBA9003100.1 signal transduction histidine kinase [Thermomonospora cellulosilytica]
MPDFFEPAAGAERQDVRRHGRPLTRGKRRQSSSIRAFHLSISVLPAAVVGLFGLAAVAVLYSGDAVTQKTRLVLAVAAAGAAITLGAAVLAADAATRRMQRQYAQSAVRDRENVQRWLGELGFLVAQGRQDLQELVERLRAGETVASRAEDHPATDTGDPFQRLACELRKAQSEAWNVALDAASRKPTDGADRRVGVFVNLARRMQTLSHRAIQGLDELENQVEDPDLLKGLFRVDHLTTRMRRQAESLAVIGGAASRRQWTRPVTVYEVLRSAIAEVEHYNRVKVVPPVDGTLHGGAVADVIHLLAELIENATKFSPPHTQVLVRVESVTAGLAIEIEDRGLGIPREDQRRLNDLLADHEQVDTGELLQDGRIGLLVVSALARRHNVRVQLQGNLYGGTQAVVVVPKELVGTEAEKAAVRPQAQPAHSLPAPAPAASAPAAVSAPPRLAGFEQGVDAGPDPAGDDRDALGARPAARPSAAAEVRSDPQAGVPAPRTGPTRPTGAGERPPLPRRQAQTHLAPELVNAPEPRQDDQEVEHNPGLMAAFQKGMRSALENDGTADDIESAN